MLTITLSAAGYTAVFAPANGGALLSLKKDGIELFHQGTEEEVLAAPTHYGLPVLFPPNRIDGGTFTFEGVTSSLPINEPARGNSLHGFLHNRPWQVEAYSEDEDTAEIVMAFEADEDSDFYRYYPYCFVAEQIYRIDKDGLHQTFRLTNDSGRNMPFGLAWHTALRLPGLENGRSADCKVRVSVGKRVQVSERMLPTGVLLPLSADEEAFRSEEGGNVLYAEMDDHFTAEPIALDGKPFHGAVLTDPDGRYRVEYEVDPFYKHWMIWNCRADGRFVCIEPQNWRINAPNLDLPLEESGLGVLADQASVDINACIRLISLQ